LYTRFQATIWAPARLNPFVEDTDDRLLMNGSLDRRRRVGGPTLDSEGEAQKCNCGHPKGEEGEDDCDQQIHDESRSHLDGADDHGHTVEPQGRQH